MTGSPFVREMNATITVSDALCALHDWSGLILFDSALPRGRLGQYSFLTADPFETVVVPEPRSVRDPFARVRSRLQELQTEPLADLPPFQGGAAGILSYELGASFECLPSVGGDRFRIPGAVIGLYDWVIAWDHRQGRCWFLGQGFPEQTDPLRTARSRDRYQRVRQALESPDSRNPGFPWKGIPKEPCSPSGEHRGFELPGHPGVLSNFTRDSYCRAVQRVIDYIRAGDIFQANLSQRLMAPAKTGPIEQYLRLRRENPATFGGYFSHDDWAVLSSSPERFVQVTNGLVSTRPIKGTRSRRRNPEADLFTRDELRESEKDRAENVMIVDLLRNDLSRVCRPGSIRVPELCSVETYETVTHLVSEVSGQLREGATFWDLMAASFPGGSITGAPKIRAMEIITELEQVPREAYCGSLFYCGFDGTADSNILIRTITQRNGWLSFPAGGGIVAQSDPEAEYEETLHKAAGMLRAV